ncbi:MAG TPA: VTT domain-containing protein [Clostridiaceae bacterium]
MRTIMDFMSYNGYLVLFLVLFFELIALPTPGETLMTYCGYLVHQGKLNLFLTILVATAAAISGITISYFIGLKLGNGFLIKYGKYVHLKEDKIKKVSDWNDKYGQRLLLIGYFIPGVRHLTGIVSGTAKLSYKKFAINAYLGALIWATTFVFLGKALGAKWDSFHSYAKNYILIGSLIIAFILIIFSICRYFKSQINSFIYKWLFLIFSKLRKLEKAQIAIGGVSLIFLTFFVVLIFLAREYMEKDLRKFDRITIFTVKALLNENNLGFIKYFTALGNFQFLILVFALTIMFIMGKGHNRILELKFSFFICIGSEVLAYIFRNLFHRLGPMSMLLPGIKYSFPSSSAIMTVSIYGFGCYLLIKHSKSRWLSSLSLILFLVFSLFLGLGTIYLNLEFPGDIIGGYILGLLWLTFNIVLMELFRLLYVINKRRPYR